MIPRPTPSAPAGAPAPGSGDAPLVAVCWALDGTLLHGGAVGGDVLRRAFAAVTGLVAPGPIAMGGMTDRLVADAFRDALPAADAAALHARGDGYGEDFAAAVAREWADRGAELEAVSVLLPGVRAVLDALAAEPHVVQAVVTGNVRAGAEAKLAAVGLLPGPLDLEVGAFGDIPGPRAGLVHAAREAVRARHRRPVALVVVGDTPRDVEAAHVAGAVAVGVATGSATAGELHAAGAEHVLADLSDSSRLLAAVRTAREDGVRTTRGSV